MAHVDEDVRALGRRLDGAPGGVRRVHLDDVGGVLRELGGGGVGVGAISRGLALSLADDEHDLGLVGRCGGRDRVRERAGGGDEQSDRERKGELTHGSVSLRAHRGFAWLQTRRGQVRWADYGCALRL